MKNTFFSHSGLDPESSIFVDFLDSRLHGNDGYEFSRIDNRNRCVCHYWSISSNRYKVGILYREKGVADFFVDGIIADRIIIIY